MTILLLAPEIIVDILRFVSAHDVRNCQQVCHRFREAIVESPYLQYILTLERTGYQPPLRIRRDLDYAQMIQILRNNRDAWRSSTELADPLLIKIFTPNVVFSSLVDGVFAYMAEERTGHGLGESRTLPTIYFHQLPSKNKGTEYKHWHHKLDYNVVDIAIQPEIDLLVLLTYNDLPGQGGSNHIHLRTISTDDPHPLATSPTLNLNVSYVTRARLMREDRFLRVYGRMIGIHYDGLARRGQGAQYIPAIWDWVAGIKVAHITFPSPGKHSMAFLSEDYFVVPQYGEVDQSGMFTGLGSLDVYRLPLSDIQTRPSVRFMLPKVSEAFKYLELTIARNLAPATRATQQQPPARVYELAQEARQFRIFISSGSFKQNSHSGIGKGWLHVSIGGLLKLLHEAQGGNPGLSIHDEPLEIPWSSWAGYTSWISLTTRGRDWTSIWGQRCASLRIMKREIGEPDALRNNFYVIDFDRYRNRDGPAVEPTPAEPWVGASWEREDLHLWARRGDTIFNGSPPLSTLHLRKLALKKYKILDLEGNEVEHTLGFNKVMIDDEHIAILAAENDGVTPYGLIVYTI